MAVMFEVHRGVGYLVAVVVLVTAMMAFGRAKNAQEFTAGPYRLAFGLLTLQVLLGLAFYAMEGYWDTDVHSPLVAYVHPALGVAALGLGQAMLGRARKTRMAVDAHRLAGRGLMAALVLVVAAIVVATVA